MSPIDYEFLAKLLISLLMLGLLVFVLLPTFDANEIGDSRPRVPHPLDELRSYDAGNPLDPALVAAIPLEELDRDTLVDAMPTPVPADDVEFDRCSLCGAPLSSLTDECWVCATKSERRGAA